MYLCSSSGHSLARESGSPFCWNGSTRETLRCWVWKRFWRILRRLTIVGGVRDAWVVVRRGRWGTVRARVASPAWVPGRSASPLDVTGRAVRAGGQRDFETVAWLGAARRSADLREAPSD